MKKNIFPHRQKILVLILVIFVAILSGVFLWKGHFFNNTSPEPVTLRLPVDIWPGNFWILVADANGFFKEEGLNVELIDVAGDYFGWIDRLKTGEIDTMAISIYDFVKQNIAGSELVIVWQSDNSEGADGIVAKQGIDNISQLRGKKIGVGKGTYLDYLLDTAMLLNGIDNAEFTRVDIKWDDLPKSYASGDVDAIVTWEPDLSQIAQEHGGSKIFDTSKIKGFAINVFPFRREFLNNNPETIRRLLRVWEKATNYIKENHLKTLDMIAKYPFKGNMGEKYTTDDVQAIMDADLISDLDENLRAFRFSSGYDSLYGNFQYAFRYFQRASKSTPELDVDKMIDPTFIHNFH